MNLSPRGQVCAIEGPMPAPAAAPELWEAVAVRRCRPRPAYAQVGVFEPASSESLRVLCVVCCVLCVVCFVLCVLCFVLWGEDFRRAPAPASIRS